MFEDVFEPFDDIINGDPMESDDDWNIDLWDTGEKEDMWRTDIKDVWSVDDGTTVNAPAPKPDPVIPWPILVPEEEIEEDCSDGKEDCPDGKEESKDSGLFDDLF